jgi:hypothetical protein
LRHAYCMRWRCRQAFAPGDQAPAIPSSAVLWWLAPPECARPPQPLPFPAAVPYNLPALFSFHFNAPWHCARSKLLLHCRARGLTMHPTRALQPARPQRGSVAAGRHLSRVYPRQAPQRARRAAGGGSGDAAPDAAPPAAAPQQQAAPGATAGGPNAEALPLPKRGFFSIANPKAEVRAAAAAAAAAARARALALAPVRPAAASAHPACTPPPLRAGRCTQRRARPSTPRRSRTATSRSSFGTPNGRSSLSCRRTLNASGASTWSAKRRARQTPTRPRRVRPRGAGIREGGRVAAPARRRRRGWGAGAGAGAGVSRGRKGGRWRRRLKLQGPANHTWGSSRGRT